MVSTRLVDTGYVRAVLTLPGNLTAPISAAVDRGLPGGWCLTPSDGSCQVAVQITVGAPRVRVTSGTVRVRLPAAVAASDTLAYVTYTALERTRQQNHKVTVHATALHAPDGRAVLLLGSKGTGKTSTAFALAERGWTHAGDDLVVLGQDQDGRLMVWPGKPTAAVRDPDRPLARKPSRDLAPFAAAEASVGWIVRLATHPALSTSLTSALPMSVNERLRLHENLGRYISGLPTPLGGVTAAPYGPVWPLDTARCARWRSDLITALGDSRFDYLHAPTAADAADLLAKEAA